MMQYQCLILLNGLIDDEKTHIQPQNYTFSHSKLHLPHLGGKQVCRVADGE